MCGIAGVLALGNGRRPERAEIDAMVAKLRHRGPDATGALLDGAVGLGHARLSIIDLAGGNQPIHNEDRSVWVILNGEIFNYIELRDALEARGHRFYTHSDTEAIVHLYEEHGEDFVSHLNGQFAVALWDIPRQRLVLARDRVGIRPLFHARCAGRVLFASEVKALFALPEVPRQLDAFALADVCTFWSALPPRSSFAGVESLPPGHVMVVDAAGTRLRRYWDWQFADVASVDVDPVRSIADVRAMVIDAVRLQLRADVPVGAYLSGGLDSAIIAAVIRNHTSVPLRTFSLTFEDAEFDESIWQRRLADSLGAEHTSIRCTRQDIAAAFPRTVWHAESPIVRTAPTPLMLLSGHVHQAGYKVVVSGEGADEVFGGYDIFKEAKIRRFWARQPHSKFRPRILERLYPYLERSPARSAAFGQAFFREGMEHADQPWFAHIPRWTTTGRIRSFFSTAMREATGEWSAYDQVRRILPPEMAQWPPMGRDQYVEAHTLMSGYLLSAQGDRVAMANSVEGRVPFLDHRVIEAANRLPPQLKIRGLREKYLLRKAFEDMLPKDIANRTKQPYRAPDSQSFFNAGVAVEYVAELLSPDNIADAGYFDPAATTRLFEKCRAGRVIGFADNMAFVAILSTMLLHEQFIRRRGSMEVS